MDIPPGTTIIFDLDGTLVDTAPDLAAAMNAVLKAAGRRDVPLDEVRRLVGRGARVLIERGFAATGDAVGEDALDTHVQGFLDFYGANLVSGSVAFPRVLETLEVLKASGAKMGVCTNKPHDLSEAVLEGLKLAHYFPSIHGAGRRDYNKPDPRHIWDVIDELGGARDKAIMIGDSITDVDAARAAKIPVILLSYGYTEIPARDLGADAVTDDFAELPALIAKVMAR